jgi:hypothetical protein
MSPITRSVKEYYPSYIHSNIQFTMQVDLSCSVRLPSMSAPATSATDLAFDDPISGSEQKQEAPSSPSNCEFKSFSSAQIAIFLYDCYLMHVVSVAET